MPGTEHVAPFGCYRCPYGTVDATASRDSTLPLACARMIDYVLEREGDVAAVIAEPMRAVPYIPPPGFWQAVRAACDRARHAADLRRDPDRPRQDRPHVRLRA